MIHSNSRRGLLAAVGAGAAVLALAGAAFACTTYRGTLTVGTGTSAASRTGNNSGMGYCAGSGTGTASIGSTSFYVEAAPASTCLVSGSNKLPPTVTNSFLGLSNRIYWVDYRVGSGDCMHGQSGNQILGNITIDNAGAGSGTYPQAGRTYSPTIGSGQVCVSDTSYYYGNQVPVNVI